MVKTVFSPTRVCKIARNGRRTELTRRNECFERILRVDGQTRNFRGNRCVTCRVHEFVKLRQCSRVCSRKKGKKNRHSFRATRPFLSPRGFAKKKRREKREVKEEREERKGIAERGDVTSCRRPTGTAGMNEWKGLCASIFSGVVNPLAAWPVLTALNSVNVLPRVLLFPGKNYTRSVYTCHSRIRW